MCGIAGFKGSFPPELIQNMRRLIRHRGPDDQGLYYDNDSSAALAHTRLSIIDLSALGHQPMVTDDNQVVLVFNGEIYNYRELRRKLELNGVVFRGHSDTEVVLRLYELEGESALSKLNGIFALAFWDKRDAILRVARDGFGVKPLYYAFCDEGFIFASEIKAILQCRSISRDLDSASLFRTIGLLWTPGPSTCFKSVKKLRAGHLLRIDKLGAITEEQFYRLPHGCSDESMSLSTAIDITRAQLTLAVERQLMADAPVGAFLSGGLDSSAIVALATQKKGVLPCFTIQPEADTEDGTVEDLPYARQVANAFNCPLEVIKIRHDMYRDLEQMIWYLDEPQADFAPLNVYYICKNARQQGIKVLLSGAGGDDLFTGYRRHTAINYSRYFEYLPMLLRNMGPVLGQLLPKSGLARRMGKFLNELPLSEDQRIAGYFLWLNQKRLYSLFRQEFLEDIEFTNIADLFAHELEQFGAERHPVDKCLFLEQKYFLVDHNLNYTDKLSMATGIEVRVPFLDHDLVAAAASIPVKYKQKGVAGKYVLKKAMEGILPHDVIWRPKSGFGAPVRHWLRHELSGFVDDLLSADNIRKRGVFDEYQVGKLIGDDRNGKIDASYVVLAIVCFEIWCRQFVDSASPTKTSFLL